MSVVHMQLQPTLAAHNLNFEIHILQLPVALLNSLVPLWPQVDIEVRRALPFSTPHTGPPRDYLRLIRILLI